MLREVIAEKIEVAPVELLRVLIASRDQLMQMADEYPTWIYFGGQRLWFNRPEEVDQAIEALWEDL